MEHTISSAAFSLLLNVSLDAAPPALMLPTAPTNQFMSAKGRVIAQAYWSDGKIPALSATVRVAMTALMGTRVERSIWLRNI